MSQQSINFRTTKVKSSAAAIDVPNLKRPLDQDNTEVDEVTKRAKLTAEGDTNSAATIAPENVQNSVPPVLSGYKGLQPLHRPNHIYLTSQTFLSPINLRDQNALGTLYLFTRDGDPNHVKIGMTSSGVNARATAIRNTCHFTPRFHVTIPEVPFAPRVEFMIHKELESLGLRRIEEICKFGGLNDNGEHDPTDSKLCKGRHREWFEVSIDGPAGAMSLMERWVRLFREARPYNEDGTLKVEWMDKISTLKGNERMLSVSVLFAIWTELRKPHLAIPLQLVRRQVVWTLQTANKRQCFTDITKRKRECEARLDIGQKANEANIVLAKDACAQKDDEVCAPLDHGCCREWFSDCPGEQVSLGCGNLDHGDRVCAFEMVSIFEPF